MNSKPNNTPFFKLVRPLRRESRTRGLAHDPLLFRCWGHRTLSLVHRAPMRMYREARTPDRAPHALIASTATSRARRNRLPAHEPPPPPHHRARTHPTRNIFGLTIDPTELGDLPSLHDGSSAPHHDGGSAAASRRHGPTTPHFMLHCDTNPTIGNRYHAECTCDVSGQVGCSPRQNGRNEPNECFRICRCEAGDSKHQVSVVTDAEDPLQAAVVDALMDTRL